jgi:chromosome segregation ATPase
MKPTSKHLAIPFGALVLACSLANGEEPGGSGLKSEIAALHTAVEQLRAEVNLLRTNLIRLQLERHRENVRRLQSELEALRPEFIRLDELDRARQQDLRDIEALLASGNLASAERSEIEMARGDLAVARGGEIDRQSEAARARESELVRRLETEQQLLNRLAEADRLSGGKTQ